MSIESIGQDGGPLMSAPTLHDNASQARRSADRGLRLRLKPAHRSRGFVQGAWWPRSTDLVAGLRPLLPALSSRLAGIDRVIYDENVWAPTPLEMEFGSQPVILEGSGDQSINILSVVSEQFGRLVLLVVPPYTDPTRAYTIVMTAARLDDTSTADELLGIDAREAEDRRAALIAHQRWESEGGALRDVTTVSRRTSGRTGGPARSVTEVE
ncbi:MAG: DUF5994 family protein [Mycobacterium sp.]